MKKVIVIDETQMNTLKKACAIAAANSDDDKLTLKIAETIGDITYQFEMKP